MKIISRYTFLTFAAASAFVWQSCKEDDQTVGTPTIVSFSPSAGGPVGTYVTINGAYYGVSKPSVVKFNGAEAEILISGPASIGALVPAGATTGKISVIVEGHTGTSASDFVVSAGNPAPAVISFTPTNGSSVDGVVVTINGVNFSKTLAENEVSFNGATTTPTKVSDNGRSMEVTVPAGATKGKISVKVGGLTGTSGADFDVPAPKITAFTPSGSIEGSTVVISGSNFSKTAVNNIVKFGSTQASVTDASATSLTVVVPAGAATGKISVTVDGQTATSEKDFTVK